MPDTLVPSRTSRVPLLALFALLTLSAWNHAQRVSSVTLGRNRAADSRLVFPAERMGVRTSAALASASADFDGDGRLDAVVADARGISVYFPNGHGRFRSTWSASIFNGVNAVAAGDLDGNGAMDIVATTRFGQMHAYLGAGDGTFLYGGISSAVGGYGIELVELNGDGVLDAVTVGLAADVYSLLGLGDGTFEFVDTFVPKSPARRLTAGDFNGDGFADVITGGSARALSLLRGNGDGTFQDAVGLSTSGIPGSGFSEVPLLVDVEGDGDLDLLFVNGSNLVLRRRLASGNLGPPIVSPAQGSPLQMSVGDTNGDGRLDVVYWTGLSDDRVVVATGSGSGVFTTLQSMPVGGAARPPLLGHWTQDNRLDLLVPGAAPLIFLVGDKFGGFVAPRGRRAGGGPKHLATADLDGNGALDLVVANGADNDLSVHLGNGDGTFVKVTPDTPVSDPAWIAAADFDGDQVVDLALTQASGPNVIVLLGNGDGTFVQGQSIPTGSGVCAAGDLNGDSDVDLVVALDAAVTVLLGAGDGTFTIDATYAMGGGTLDVVLEDFDLDGRLDVATPSTDEQAVSVRLGTGGGALGTEVRYPSGSWPLALATADMNGDSIPDLVAQRSIGQVALLLGQGDGSFAHAVMQPGASHDVALVDLDRDGRCDVLGVSYSGNLLQVSLGRPNASLGQPSSYYAGERPIHLVTGDFDGNGLPDAAVLSETREQVLVHLNQL